jgi:hypothetical protein
MMRSLRHGLAQIVNMYVRHAEERPADGDAVQAGDRVKPPSEHLAPLVRAQTAVGSAGDSSQMGT